MVSRVWWVNTKDVDERIINVPYMYDIRDIQYIYSTSIYIYVCIAHNGIITPKKWLSFFITPKKWMV